MRVVNLILHLSSGVIFCIISVIVLLWRVCVILILVECDVHIVDCDIHFVSDYLRMVKVWLSLDGYILLKDLVSIITWLRLNGYILLKDFGFYHIHNTSFVTDCKISTPNVFKSHDTFRMIRFL